MSNVLGCTTGGKTSSSVGRRVSRASWRLGAPGRATCWTHRSSIVRCNVSAPQSKDSGALQPVDTNEQASVPEPGDAASLVGSAWDPEGLFSKSSPMNFAAGEQMGDLIARRERERAARRAAAAAAAMPSAAPETFPSPAAIPPLAPAPTPAVIPPLPAGVRPLRPMPSTIDGVGDMPEGGWRPADLPAGLRAELDALLRRDFISVDLSWPELRVLHMDPPVITVDGFLPNSLCEQMVQQAEASGRMVASRVGASNVSASYGNASSTRRTSSGMMVTPGVAGPVMDTVVSELQSRGKRLLRAGEGPAWGVQGKLPRPGQFCYEALQVARYDLGQHFLAHEDGFPPAIATSNGFQRHATLLIYLNDVPQGGATYFDYLGLGVRPAKGKALLFFPAFLDGKSDIRSLHTAQDAVDIKYVTQQWIARGLGQPSTTRAQPAAQTLPAAATRRQEADLELRERGAGRQSKSAKGQPKAGKGFGGKPSSK